MAFSPAAFAHQSKATSVVSSSSSSSPSKSYQRRQSMTSSPSTSTNKVVTSTPKKSASRGLFPTLSASAATLPPVASTASASSLTSSAASRPSSSSSIPTPPYSLTPSISVEDFSDDGSREMRVSANGSTSKSSSNGAPASAAAILRTSSLTNNNNTASESPDSAAFSGDEYLSDITNISRNSLIISSISNNNNSMNDPIKANTNIDLNDDDDDNNNNYQSHEASTKTLLHSQIDELTAPADLQGLQAVRQHRSSTNSSSIPTNDDDDDVYDDSSSDFGSRKHIYQLANGWNGSSATSANGWNGPSTSTANGRLVSTVSLGDFASLRVPIVGFETMEKRARFTVFKVRVMKCGGGGGGEGGGEGGGINGSNEATLDDFDRTSSSTTSSSSWFVFRRFTDFVRLRDRLQLEFPNKRLPPLPNKKWFNKFDHDFLVQRQRQLQDFVDELLRGCGSSGSVGGGNSVGGGTNSVDEGLEGFNIAASSALKDFLCLDDPPDPHESLEESKALCEAREEEIFDLKEELKRKDRKIQLLKEQLEMREGRRKSFIESFRLDSESPSILNSRRDSFMTSIVSRNNNNSINNNNSPEVFESSVRPSRVSNPNRPSFNTPTPPPSQPPPPPSSQFPPFTSPTYASPTSSSSFTPRVTSRLQKDKSDIYADVGNVNGASADTASFDPATLIVDAAALIADPATLIADAAIPPLDGNAATLEVTHPAFDSVYAVLEASVCPGSRPVIAGASTNSAGVPFNSAGVPFNPADAAKHESASTKELGFTSSCESASSALGALESSLQELSVQNLSTQNLTTQDLSTRDSLTHQLPTHEVGNTFSAERLDNSFNFQPIC